MKRRIWKKRTAALVAVIPWFLISATAAEPAPTSAAVTNAAGTNASPATGQAGTNALRAAQPAKLRLPQDLAEVVRLKQAGIADDVIVAFIQKSPLLKSVTGEQIIYLKDLGLSPRVLTALVEHQPAPQQGALAATNAPVPVIPPWGTGGTWGQGGMVPQYPQYPGYSQYPYYQYPYYPYPAEEFYPEEGFTGTIVAGGPNIPIPLPGPSHFNPADFGLFDGALAPFGTWMDLPGHGRCWQPTAATVDPAWRPYCHNGSWCWSDSGWYWNSGYSWGWAPFHYGRWWKDSSRGWLWQPERTWGPAWVNWRQSANLVGWAPLPPDVGFSMNTGWTFKGERVRGPQSFGMSASSFTFVPNSRFLDPHLFYHTVHGEAAQAAFNQTTPIFGNGFMLTNDRHLLNVGVNPQRIAMATQRPLRPTPVGMGFEGASGQANALPAGQLPFVGVGTRGGRPNSVSAAGTQPINLLASGRWFVNKRTGYLEKIPDDPRLSAAFARRFGMGAFAQVNTGQSAASMGQQMADLGQGMLVGDMGQGIRIGDMGQGIRIGDMGQGIRPGDLGQSRGALGQRPNGLANPPNAPFGFSPMMPNNAPAPGIIIFGFGKKGVHPVLPPLMSGGGQAPGIVIYGPGKGGMGGGGGRGGGGHGGGGGGHGGGHGGGGGGGGK